MEEFGKEMREAGEKAEASLTHVSLIISVLAVLVAICTVLGHREHTSAVLLQANSSDKFSEYQARRQRVVLNENSATILSSLAPADSPNVAAALQKWQAQNDKWKPENEEALKQATEFHEKVELSERKADRFDLSEALLEIAVVLASITLLTKHQRYVAAGVLLGIAGVVIGASAFLVR